VIPGCKTRTGAPALCFTSFADGVTLSASWRHRHCWVQDLLWRSRFVFHVVCCCCHFVCVAAPLSSLGAKPALALPLCVSRRALPSSLLAITSSTSGRHCHRWVQDPLWRSCFVFHVVDHHHHFVHVVAPPSSLGARPALALPLHHVLPSPASSCVAVISAGYHFVCVGAPPSSLGSRPALVLPLRVSRHVSPSCARPRGKPLSSLGARPALALPLRPRCRRSGSVMFLFGRRGKSPSLLGATPALLLPLRPLTTLLGAIALHSTCHRMFKN
jgi:hypothetical protein